MGIAMTTSLEAIKAYIARMFEGRERAAEEGDFERAEKFSLRGIELMAQQQKMIDAQRSQMLDAIGMTGPQMGLDPPPDPDDLLAKAVQEIVAHSQPRPCPSCELSIYPQDTNSDCKSDPGCHVTARLVADYVRKKLNPQTIRGVDYAAEVSESYTQIMRTPYGFTGNKQPVGIAGTPSKPQPQQVAVKAQQIAQAIDLAKRGLYGPSKR